MTSDSKKSHTVKRIFGYVTPVLLTIFFLYFTFNNVDLGASFHIIKNSSLLWMIVFVLAFLLSHVIRAFRWKYIINNIKENTSFTYLFASIMIGYGVNCVVPRLGEVYRALFSGRWEGISRTSVLGTVVIERVIDILALGFSVLISVMIYSGDLYEDVSWLKLALIIGFLTMGSIITLLVLLIKLKDKFTRGIIKFVSSVSHPLADKLSYLFNMLIDGFASLQGFKNYFYTIFYTVLIMVIYGLTSLLGMYVLKMDEIQVVNFEMAWVVMTISAFGIVIPTPGGTGSYHFIVKSVLVALYGFSDEVSSAFALLTHFVSYVIFVSSMLIMIHIVNLKRQKLGLSKENFFSVIKSNRNPE